MKFTQVQTVWRFGIAIFLLMLVLYSGCSSFNNNPVIKSMNAEKDWVEFSNNCEVECVATDADGDNLNYKWSAMEGNISGEGPVVTWEAPDDEGTYIITVEVTDGNGGETRGNLTLNVFINYPPVIESLTANPSPVKQGETSIIECTAQDQNEDELNYLWTVSRGELSGEGSSITWMAPMTCGIHTITVTVTDNRSGEVSQDLPVRVIKPG